MQLAFSSSTNLCSCSMLACQFYVNSCLALPPLLLHIYMPFALQAVAKGAAMSGCDTAAVQSATNAVEAAVAKALSATSEPCTYLVPCVQL